MPLRIDLREVKIIAGDYSADQIGHVLDPHLEAIADILASYRDRKTLAFLPLISCSERLAQLARDRGIAAEHIDGTSGDRSEILKRFAGGETKLLTNAMLLTEGFDEPSVDCIVWLRPTKVRSLFAQIIGRGTRIHPGKDHLLLLDFLWLTKKHNVIRPEHLIAVDDEEAEQIGRELLNGADGDLMAAAGFANEKRLERLAQELAANRAKEQEDYDLLEFALSIGDDKLARFEPTMRWHHDAISSKQQEVLTRQGINCAAIKSKGHAAAILTRMSDRRQMGLATYKQVRLLRKWGITDPHLVTFNNASAIIGARLSARKH
jgi:superfamily II DNA/RNA helicase